MLVKVISGGSHVVGFKFISSKKIKAWYLWCLPSSFRRWLHWYQLCTATEWHVWPKHIVLYWSSMEQKMHSVNKSILFNSICLTTETENWSTNCDQQILSIFNWPKWPSHPSSYLLRLSWNENKTDWLGAELKFPHKWLSLDLYRGHVKPGPLIINLPRQGAARAGLLWSSSDKRPLDSICKPIFIYDIGLPFLSPETHDSLPLHFILGYVLDVFLMVCYSTLAAHSETFLQMLSPRQNQE